MARTNLFSSAQSEDKHYNRNLERISDHDLALGKMYGTKEGCLADNISPQAVSGKWYKLQ